MNLKQVIGLLGLILLVFYGHQVYRHLAYHNPLSLLSSCSAGLSEPERLIALGGVIVVVLWVCKQGR